MIDRFKNWMDGLSAYQLAAFLYTTGNVLVLSSGSIMIAMWNAYARLEVGSPYLVLVLCLLSISLIVMFILGIIAGFIGVFGFFATLFEEW